TKTVKVRETQSCIVPVDKKNFKIEIEYSIKNNGPGTLKELGCFASTPQTYKPFQIVKEVNPSISNTDVVYDQSWNKITHFDFEGEELEPGEELTATIVCDVDMLQFDFLDMDYRSLKYSEEDDDLVLYTMDDLYIDSGHPEIRKTATEVIGDEERPAVIMEKLYNFVINHLNYDYQRAEDRNYPLLYASEILDRGEGVCADYAILYTALLRASGIPSRVASGIPIYTMLLEGGQLSMGHAWVEIKFPEFGWLPVDITIENRFMARDMNMNLVTQRGSGFLHKNTTMDWSSYYYDGFSYSWEEDEAPDVEQQLSYSIRE
ncbi:MAG: transglutaminase-like domain-containing protein, partial [Candidatus Humimicrobiaceae bacterium]